MDQQPISARLFHGTTKVLRPGDKLPLGACCSHDLPEALLHAWRAASEGAESPFVYEVSLDEGQQLTIMRDMLIDGRLAGQALDLAAGIPFNQQL